MACNTARHRSPPNQTWSSVALSNGAIIGDTVLGWACFRVRCECSDRLRQTWSTGNHMSGSAVGFSDLPVAGSCESYCLSFPHNHASAARPYWYNIAAESANSPAEASGASSAVDFQPNNYGNALSRGHQPLHTLRRGSIDDNCVLKIAVVSK